MRSAKPQRLSSEQQLTPEFLLAASCAIWPHSNNRTERIRTAAAEPIDWTAFLRVIRRQRVVGLVHDGLARARPSIPEEISQEIVGEATTLLRENSSHGG